jgi:hypothetical protein
VLSIEDVLPFFGDMATIDDFKAKVVDALEAYDAQIDGLKKEMDGLAESAREVHRELDALAARQLTVSPHAKCALSGQRVLEGPFYVFPSGFACAQQPLIRFVTPHLPPHKQRRVRDLCARLGYPPPPPPPAPAPTLGGGTAASKAAAAREAAKEQERLEALREGPGATLSAAERDAFQLQLDDLVRTGGGSCLGVCSEARGSQSRFCSASSVICSSTFKAPFKASLARALARVFLLRRAIRWRASAP